MDPAEIEDLFDQLDEDFSDSGPDVDTISIGSTPKPSLKPFFCSNKNLTNSVFAAKQQSSSIHHQSKYRLQSRWRQNAHELVTSDSNLMNHD